MKKISKNILSSILLSLALLNFSAGFSSVEAQETRRDRVIAKPTPPPKQTLPPEPSVTPAQSPTPAPSVTPTPIPAQTLAELQGRIRQVLARPAIQRGQIGVKIVSLDSGKVLFEENAEKYFMPASNMKSYTVAAALARLSPEFRFVTSVYANSAPDADGVIRGDLTVYGRGDPSIAADFNDGDYYKALDQLAQKIAAAGVKRIEGNLIGDESYFNTEPVPSTWEWDDLQWYYGAEVSALTINGNALDLTVRPGAAIGAPASAVLAPNVGGLILMNRVTTARAGARREISVYRKLGSNVLEVSGTIPLGANAYQSSVAVARPAYVFVSMLRQMLEQKGVKIVGQTRAVNFREKYGVLPPAPSVSTPPTLVEIAKLESQPFSLIAAKTMKPSNNLYTELILRALGEAIGDKQDAKKTSEARGLEVVKNFLSEAGILADSVVQYDGSGLSRHDLITPASAVRLYEFMNRHQYAQTWHDAQTIGGVDGTLKSRFVGSRAATNVRGKTGTIDQVSALSGYVKTAAGETLAFSVLTNGIPQGSQRTATIDEIVVALANFSGRSN